MNRAFSISWLLPVMIGTKSSIFLVITGYDRNKEIYFLINTGYYRNTNSSLFLVITGYDRNKDFSISGYYRLL